MIPIGVNPTSIGVSGEWWLDAARQLEAAGFESVWCWDHFVSRGRREDSVLECWTTLGAAAARTSRLGVGSFVTNVLNRHPSVLARTAASLQELSGGRVRVGIGIGGHPREHEALGIGFPDVPERVARLEEAAQVLRLLWAGGPADFEGTFYRLRHAVVHPADPPPPLIVGGETPAGARLAARIGDGWTTEAATLERNLPRYLEELQRAGRDRGAVRVVVAVRIGGPEPEAGEALLADLRGESERWRERGADAVVLSYVRPDRLPDVLRAAERAGLGGR